jgi:hypothetical protein
VCVDEGPTPCATSCVLCALGAATPGPLQVEILLAEGFTPTCLAHPDTYLNKVLVGGEGGRAQLWNFSSGKLLYEFVFASGSDVRCIASSPALDVVGIGFADGWGAAACLPLQSLFAHADRKTEAHGVSCSLMPGCRGKWFTNRKVFRGVPRLPSTTCASETVPGWDARSALGSGVPLHRASGAVGADCF